MSALVKMIKEQCLFNQDEQLYISNPKFLNPLLNTLNLSFLYDPIINVGNVSIFQNDSISDSKRLAEVQRLKIAYCLKKGNIITEEYNSLIEGIINTKVNSREIIIYPFATQYKNIQDSTKLPESTGSSPESKSQIMSETRNFYNFYKNLGKEAYLSTPRFIKYLTDLSSELMTCDNKLGTLREELAKINSKLPSNVYIPFVNGQVRESVVLSIPPGESKIFTTKGKVPYLIAVEIFDPLEIAYDPLIGMISPRLGPGTLPAPPLPAPTQKEKKKQSNKNTQKTNEEMIREKIEKILNQQYDSKSKKIKQYDDGPITINQLKMQKIINGIFVIFLTIFSS